MKRYIVISALVHLLFFYGVSIKFEHSKEQKSAQEETTVTLIEGEKSSDHKESGRDVKVIELSPLGQGEPKVLDKYYWGVGISGEYIMLESGIQAYKVNEVYSGYSADSSGILAGDVIYSVNGGSVGLNDISGNGPAHLILGILRNSRIIFINLERMKIFY